VLETAKGIHSSTATRDQTFDRWYRFYYGSARRVVGHPTGSEPGLVKARAREAGVRFPFSEQGDSIDFAAGTVDDRFVVAGRFASQPARTQQSDRFFSDHSFRREGRRACNRQGHDLKVGIGLVTRAFFDAADPEELKPRETGKNASTAEMSPTGVWSKRNSREATAEQGRLDTGAFVDAAVRSRPSKNVSRVDEGCGRRNWWSDDRKQQRQFRRAE
jgi:hypothetical protein